MNVLEPMETIGDRIRTLRLKEGLTQAGLAEKVYVTGNTVDKWEHSKSRPSLEMIGTLASFFDVSCDELITGTGTDNKTVVDELGLSNNSIKVLKEQKANENFFIPVAINLLLSPQYIDLLKSIFKYLNTNYMYPTPISTDRTKEFPIEFILAFPPLKHVDGQSIEFYETKEKDIYDLAALHGLMMDFVDVKKKAYESSVQAREYSEKKEEEKNNE